MSAQLQKWIIKIFLLWRRLERADVSENVRNETGHELQQLEKMLSPVLGYV